MCSNKAEADTTGAFLASTPAIAGLPKDARGEPQARQLHGSIDVSTVVGLRDRARIALMTFSFASVSAA